jgi:adenosine deaminase
MSVPVQPFFSPQPEPCIQALPKVNLHTHLEGSIRPQTFWELANELGIPVPPSPEGARDLLQVNGSETSLVDYLKKISINYPVLRKAAALRRTAFEAAEDAARDGVIYLELRFGPVTHASPDLPLEKVIESVVEGLRQAEAAYPITCRLITAALRHHDPQANLRLAQVAIQLRSRGVVGFDLAGDEAHYPAQLHAAAIQVANQGGLGITVHAGEAAGAENVIYAVRELGARRIGHGTHSISSPAALALLRERGVLLEVCPTSNVHTQAVPEIDQHPVRRLFEEDISISIGDDDPVTSCTRVSNELTLLRGRFAFDYAGLGAIQQMGMRDAFLEDENLRQRLMTKLSDEWNKAK